MKPNRLAGLVLFSFCLAMTSLVGCAKIKVQTAGLVDCTLPPFDQQAEVRHSLDVVAHPKTNFDVQRTAPVILAQATKVAQERQDNDFACKIKLDYKMPPNDVPLNMEVPLNASRCVGEGKICDPDDFFAVIQTDPPGVKVLMEIQWCGAFTLGRFFGCSFRNGNSMIVVSECKGDTCLSLNREGVGWIHELGHLQGLPDRRRNDFRPVVMRGVIEEENTRLTQCDCVRFRQYPQR